MAIRLLTLLSRGLTVLAGIASFLVMLLIAVDVTLRFVGGGVPGTLDIVVYYLMISVAFLALPQVERQDGMISVGALFDALGPESKRWVMGFAALVTALVFGGVAYASWVEAMRQYTNGAYVVNTAYVLPVWPAYFLVPLAFALATVIALLRAGLALAGQRAPSLRQSFGLGVLVPAADDTGAGR